MDNILSVLDHVRLSYYHIMDKLHVRLQGTVRCLCVQLPQLWDSANICTTTATIGEWLTAEWLWTSSPWGRATLTWLHNEATTQAFVQTDFFEDVATLTQHHDGEFSQRPWCKQLIFEAMAPLTQKLNGEISKACWNLVWSEGQLCLTAHWGKPEGLLRIQSNPCQTACWAIPSLPPRACHKLLCNWSQCNPCLQAPSSNLPGILKLLWDQQLYIS